MTNLGPTPAPRLEPLRLGDRESGRNDQKQPPPKSLRPAAKASEPEPETDFVPDEDHQLDERA